MAEQLLDRADVVTGFEQVGGETVAEGVAARRLGDPGLADRAADGLLQRRLGQMVPSLDPGARVDRPPRGGKEILPGRFAPGIRRLYFA